MRGMEDEKEVRISVGENEGITATIKAKSLYIREKDSNTMKNDME